jgi:hypothetical protein
MTTVDHIMPEGVDNGGRYIVFREQRVWLTVGDMQSAMQVRLGREAPRTWG